MSFFAKVRTEARNEAARNAAAHLLNTRAPGGLPWNSVSIASAIGADFHFQDANFYLRVRHYLCKLRKQEKTVK
jgi:hypothetical protein